MGRGRRWSRVGEDRSKRNFLRTDAKCGLVSFCGLAAGARRATATTGTTFTQASREKGHNERIPLPEGCCSPCSKRRYTRPTTTIGRCTTVPNPPHISPQSPSSHARRLALLPRPSPPTRLLARQPHLCRRNTRSRGQNLDAPGPRKPTASMRTARHIQP